MSRIKPLPPSPQLPDPPQAWEVHPYAVTELTYALWISHGSYSTVDHKYRPHAPSIALASQDHPSQLIELRTVRQVDELVARLLRARAWIVDSEQAPSDRVPRSALPRTTLIVPPHQSPKPPKGQP